MTETHVDTGIRTLSNATPLAVLVAFATQVAVASIAYVVGFGAIFVSALAAFASVEASPGAAFVASLTEAWALLFLIAGVGHTVLAVMIVQRRRASLLVVTGVSVAWLPVMLHSPMVWPLVMVLLGSAAFWWAHMLRRHGVSRRPTAEVLR